MKDNLKNDNAVNAKFLFVLNNSIPNNTDMSSSTTTIKDIQKNYCFRYINGTNDEFQITNNKLDDNCKHQKEKNNTNEMLIKNKSFDASNDKSKNTYNNSMPGLTSTGVYTQNIINGLKHTPYFKSFESSSSCLDIMIDSNEMLYDKSSEDALLSEDNTSRDVSDSVFDD